MQGVKNLVGGVSGTEMYGIFYFVWQDQCFALLSVSPLLFLQPSLIMAYSLFFAVAG